MSPMAPPPSSSGTKFQSAFLRGFIPFPENHARFSFKIRKRPKIDVPVQSCILPERDGRSCLKHHPSARKKEYLRGDLTDTARFDFNSVKEILGFIERSGKLGTLSLFNEILSILITRDKNDLASQLYSYLPTYGLVPDRRTFSLMIRCHCRRNELDEAQLTVDHMLERGYQPDVATLTILIDLLCKNGKLQKAFEILDSMGKTMHYEPTIRIYNCLLKGLCYVGRVEEAYEMLSAIKKKESVTPDVYTYTAVMDGFCKVGRSDDAKELLDEALDRGLEPGAVTYNTLFDGYCREGTPGKGFRLLELMRERNCSADSITYNTFLNGLLKWGKIRAALSVYREMEGMGVETEERIAGCLFRCVCGKSLEEPDLVDDAHQVFDEMSKRVDDDPSAYSLMIRALCVGERLDEALECLNRAIELGFVPRTVTFNNLIQGLSVEGRMEEAVRVLLVMYGHGKIPSKTSYQGLIKEVDGRGMSGVASALYGAALKQGVCYESHIKC